MQYLLLLLAFPLVWPFIAKFFWPGKINWTELGINVVGIAVLVVIAWYGGTYAATADTEIWNGKIVNKDRVHGSYIRSYSCNCYTTCSGTGSNRSCSEHCSTCYEDHYTVEWSAYADFGKVQKIPLKSLDETSSSVYATPDPQRYTDCTIGEPASSEHQYTNYVRAAPNSLFNTKLEKMLTPDKIPAYPRVQNYYKISRVINVDSKISADEISALNTNLSNALRDLGPKKEVNVIVILTEIDDPSYRQTIENNWLGGKKNDAVVFLGFDDHTITWADVMTFALNSNNEMFHVKLRDDLKDIGTFDADKISATVAQDITDHFDRISMTKFEYLKDDITPPDWLIWVIVILSVGGSVGLSIVFKNVDVGGSSYYSGRYYR